MNEISKALLNNNGLHGRDEAKRRERNDQSRMHGGKQEAKALRNKKYEAQGEWYPALGC